MLLFTTLLLNACSTEPETRYVHPDLVVDGGTVSAWTVPEHRRNEAAGRCTRYGGTVLCGPGSTVECCMICDHIPDEHQCACLVYYDGAIE